MCYSSPHAAVRHLTCRHLISLCLSEALTLAQHWVNRTDVGGTCQNRLLALSRNWKTSLQGSFHGETATVVQILSAFKSSCFENLVPNGWCYWEVCNLQRRWPQLEKVGHGGHSLELYILFCNQPLVFYLHSSSSISPQQPSRTSNCHEVGSIDVPRTPCYYDLPQHSPETRVSRPWTEVFKWNIIGCEYFSSAFTSKNKENAVANKTTRQTLRPGQQLCVTLEWLLEFIQVHMMKTWVLPNVEILPCIDSTVEIWLQLTGESRNQ